MPPLRSVVACLLVCAFADVATAQTRDSTLHVRADSLLRDTGAVADTTVEGVDTVVTYQASDTILYRVHGRTMRLAGDARTAYRGQKLSAAQMDVDFNAGTIAAEGRPDSAGRSTLGTPVFDDKGSEYHGHRMLYNFRTARGNIVMSTTHLDNGYYYADKVYRETDRIYFVRNGRYTTCDDPHPHFYFASPRMKVELGSEVMAAPVFLYVADVPLFVVPFAVFPNHAGRSSGLIAPAYGQSTARGFFLQHFGYYWAPNDYVDLAATTDLYTKGSAVFDGKIEYDLRYAFTGALTGSYARVRMQPDDPITTQWNLGVTHHQTIDPRTSLDANLHFQSQNFAATTATNLATLLNSALQSDASLVRSWDNSSLSLRYARSQDLVRNGLTENGSAGYTLQQLYPFRSRTTAPGEEHWYDLFGVAYSGTVEAVHAMQDHDSVHTNVERYAVVHAPAISFTPKLGVFSVTPFFNYSEVWYPERVLQSVDPIDSSIARSSVHGFNRVWWYSAGLGVSTRLYGLAAPHLWGITALRHTLSPSVSVSFSPDFSAPSYGYYGSYHDLRSGRDVTYSYYDGELAGGPPAGKAALLNVGLANKFEMKVATSDTAEKTIDLLTGSIGASYNFAATQFRMSDVAFNARTNILGAVDLSANGVLSLYATDTALQTADKRIDRFLWQEGRGLAALTSASFSIGTQFSLMQGPPPRRDTASGASYFSGTPTPEEDAGVAWRHFLGEDGAGAVPFRLPLSVTLGFTFAQSRPYADGPLTRSASMTAGLRMQLSPTWNLSTSGYYDFVAHQLNAPAVTITKDLHCWDMTFVWFPSGYLQGFSLELRVKAPQLQDIKITKRSNARGLY